MLVGSTTVSFMVREAILRIAFVEFHHDHVPCHFGENRCGCDRETQLISLNDSSLLSRILAAILFRPIRA